jgi:hypothetical protein
VSLTIHPEFNAVKSIVFTVKKDFEYSSMKLGVHQLEIIIRRKNGIIQKK